MVTYRLHFTKQALKDAKKLGRSGLRPQAERLLDILAKDPYQRYPPYEKLLGDLTGAFSRRISLHHRLVYQVYEEEKAIKVLRMWTHYSE